jgi:hypothetical protein
MSEKLWFACPKCYLAFYNKGEYERHYGSNHVGGKAKVAELVESKG